MDRSLEEMLNEYRYERKPQEPVLAVKWTGDNLEEVRKIYPGLGEEYMRDKGCGLGFYVVVPAPGFVRFWYGPEFEERYRLVSTPAQGEELPERPKSRFIGDGTPRQVFQQRDAEAYFDALEAEIGRLKEERDRLKSLLIDAGRAAGGHILDSVSVEFLEHIPKEIRLALSASRAAALKAVQDLRKEDVSEGDRFGRGYNYAVDELEAAILARMEKASPETTKEGSNE